MTNLRVCSSCEHWNLHAMIPEAKTGVVVSVCNGEHQGHDRKKDKVLMRGSDRCSHWMLRTKTTKAELDD